MSVETCLKRNEVKLRFGFWLPCGITHKDHLKSNVIPVMLKQRSASEMFKKSNVYMFMMMHGRTDVMDNKVHVNNVDYQLLGP